MSPDPDGGDRPTATPFLAALVIIVLIVIGIWAVNVFEGDDLTDEQQIGRTAVAQNDAVQRRDFADFQAYTCRELQGSEADFTAAQQKSSQQQGHRFIDGVSGVTVDGDRATGTVTYHFDKAPDAKTEVKTTFVREDGAWKVCSVGPS
ncbi:lumazine-binding protein [Mycolicibacterium sp. S2-37]|uniref:Rv0361 family membrane protein n=1 Tax=Mycolicibacterium sp. S2-37 TaxID=2810297 RepID=UPI0027D9FDEA|nr:lumazine-binding protein [Mycolicibacterium sp. S2-37]